MTQQQTDRNFRPQKIINFEQTFTKFSNFLLNSKAFIVLKNAVIYLYDSKQQYVKSPQNPKKYFNLNTLQVQTKHNKWLHLKDIQFEECLTHQNIDKLNQFVLAIQHNRRNIIMENLFPKRFIQLNEKVNEKLLEKLDQ